MLRSKRLIRIDRDDEIVVAEDESSHLWAISYADFLMALLSFFILFFSLDGPERESTFIKVISQITKGTSLNSSNPAQDTKGRLPASVVASLQKLDIRIQKDKDTFIVDFPTDFYLPGRHHIQDGKEELIVNFLNLVKPHMDELSLYFEGHTDDTPLQKHKNDIIVDNFVLSSLRASSALRIAKSLGFSEKFLFIQAASSNLRNSRSLSIRIEPRPQATTEKL